MGTPKPILRRFKFSAGKSFRARASIDTWSSIRAACIFRQARGKFYNLMIEKRRARFERYGHARNIDLDEQIVRQISHHICKKRCVNDARAIRFRKPRRKTLSRARSMSEIVCVKLLLGFCIEGADPAQVTLDLAATQPS
jgi:hypothetical protein